MMCLSQIMSAILSVILDIAENVCSTTMSPILLVLNGDLRLHTIVQNYLLNYESKIISGSRVSTHICSPEPLPSLRLLIKKCPLAVGKVFNSLDFKSSWMSPPCAKTV